MRKLILFFTVASLALTMTSCLDGNQNFSEANFVYIDQTTSGANFGKTLNGRLIVSDKMNLWEAGTFKYFNYSWEESYGYTQIAENVNANKVAIQGDVIDITKTFLRMTPVAEVENPLHFNEITAPAFDPDGLYYDDNWLFRYSFMGKEGETPVVTFSKRNSTEQYPNEVQIDMRISKTGTPKEGATEKVMVDLVSVDMRTLRQMYAGQNKDVNIKFYYFLKDKQDLVDSQSYVMRVKSSAQ